MINLLQRSYLNLQKDPNTEKKRIKTIEEIYDDACGAEDEKLEKLLKIANNMCEGRP